MASRVMHMSSSFARCPTCTGSTNPVTPRQKVRATATKTSRQMSPFSLTSKTNAAQQGSMWCIPTVCDLDGTVADRFKL